MQENAHLIINLFFKATLLLFRWIGFVRRLVISQVFFSNSIDLELDNQRLRDTIHLLTVRLNISIKKNRSKNPRYSLKERLFVLACKEYFSIPKCRVPEMLGVSRSSVYRWLNEIETYSRPQKAHNKTPDDIARLVWDIALFNFSWGRVRIANQLKLLGIFLSASTVRNILIRPMPPKPKRLSNQNPIPELLPRKIPALYPNHVWSVDHTIVMVGGAARVYLLFAIDHYTRKVVAAAPLFGQNAGWTIDALERAFQIHGPPKHIISDQGSPFTSNAMTDLFNRWNIKHRLGAVYKHGSISVTERVIKTFKYEWLQDVHLVRNFNHLENLCKGFLNWYNNYRPHMTLNGFRPCDFNKRDLPEPIAKTAKKMPLNIRRKQFKDVNIVAYYLDDAA